MSGPTLNESYNRLLEHWNKNKILGEDEIALPECEECGTDLTGREVHCTNVLWVCDDCVEDARAGYEAAGASIADERRAEYAYCYGGRE